MRTKMLVISLPATLHLHMDIADRPDTLGFLWQVGRDATPLLPPAAMAGLVQITEEVFPLPLLWCGVCRVTGA